MNLDDLDRFIAENVFGLIPCRGAHHQSDPCYATIVEPYHGSKLLPYSTDLKIAWEAAEKANLFQNDLVSLIKNEEGLWEVRSIDYQAGDWHTWAVADTLPLVLCMTIEAMWKKASAPAAPTENSPTLIPTLNDNCFKGKSLSQTMLDGASPDAKKKSKKTPKAPAAPRKNSNRRRK